MSKKTTIYDIAKKLNITAATVSRALNNNPRISEKTKKLVLATANSLNYKQNKLAVALKSGKTNIVGVVVPYVNRNFFSSIIRGIEEELYPKGYQVIICQTHDEGQREIDNIHALLNAQVDGILMSLAKNTTSIDHLKMVLNKNVPLVFFDRKIDLNGVSSVTVNDFEGAYNATKHLIEQGAKKIAHIGGDQTVSIYRDRFEGYKKALIDHNHRFNQKFVINTLSSTEAGKIAITDLLKLKNKPDAIFTSSDYVALGAIQELKALKINVPNEFCVIGFSNEPFTKFMELSISSVDQSPIEMGKMAAKVFLEQELDKAKMKIEKKVVLSPEVLVRKSSTRNQ